MSDIQYFKRKINVGSVKATHVCSFDSSIVLTKIVQGSRKAIDSVIVSSSNAADGDNKKQQVAVKDELINRIFSIRINGMPTVLEDLSECFDDEEIIEVLMFINGADMSKFNGTKPTVDEMRSEELKNA